MFFLNYMDKTEGKLLEAVFFQDSISSFLFFFIHFASPFPSFSSRDSEKDMLHIGGKTHPGVASGQVQGHTGKQKGGLCVAEE